MRMMTQKRADFALKKTLAALNTVEKNKLKPLSAGAPSIIIQNGLGQTLAFWLAKGSKEHSAMFRIVSDWLKQTDEKSFGNCSEPKDFIEKLADIDQREFRKNQAEALAVLEWVKRFVAADL